MIFKINLTKKYNNNIFSQIKFNNLATGKNKNENKDEKMKL